MSKSKRAIVVFPKFENIFHIEQLRKQFDPLAMTIEPHITLVFPFESDLLVESLQAHIRQAIQGLSPFPIRLHGITGSDDEYLFMNIKRGNDQLIELHDRLYSGILAEYLRVEHTYVPHLTVGRLKGKATFLTALEASQQMDAIFQTIIEEVAVYRVDDKKPIEAIFRL
ncbi:Putative phosphoesterase YjcG [Anaerolineae bacterium]|nr:Putative phosphoesterase YjcG [Anaerolineae bacterium]